MMGLERFLRDGPRGLAMPVRGTRTSASTGIRPVSGGDTFRTS